jgi:hypothetical protein
VAVIKLHNLVADSVVGSLALVWIIGVAAGIRVRKCEDPAGVEEMLLFCFVLFCFVLY